MPTTHPPDRFDRPPADLQRVGAHRAPRPGGRGWIVFAWAALATAVLVGLGVFAMFVINDRVAFTSPFAPASETPAAGDAPVVQPTVDPTVNVVILNGTAVDGLAATAGDLLTSQGWTVGSRSNADASDVNTTVVFYTDPTQEGAAKGLAAALGDVQIRLSDQFVVEGDNRITIILGADYADAA
ncbi:MAG: hypothetical protein JWR33_2529 [Naasia sp.]|jgi:hypothetical protein|uniref:LytR C-terminal domain-containing protein n=1 Tax=Naasia sp. TaxID=2546198 RepID=UPI00262EE24B|nr:LytR C-terminal domain-containing protein [Naasia sp.]MCU1571788.1 hypothetical protein [Naasia sp.]